MPESFGARLRQRREEQGIALITIAEQTKIKPSLLEALEQDDVSQWPSGHYRRAFIRAYAHAIDLDPDVAVREFLEVHPEPEVDVISAMASVLDHGNARSTLRLRGVVDSAVGSLSWLRPVALRPVSEPATVGKAIEAVEDCPPAAAPALAPTDLLAVARLCAELGRARNREEVQPLLRDAANILDAIGAIVWAWDASTAQLRPAFVHGYSEKVVAQLPVVRREADNATAAAFRSAQTIALGGGDHGNAALVVPMLTPEGCSGVLAIELPHGREGTEPVRAVATILAAVLAHVTERVRLAGLLPWATRCSGVNVTAV